VPVFADVDPVTGNLTAETIAEKITPRTKAVILVHLFGRPAEMDPIVELLRERGIALIEDCAQAHWAEYAGRKVGSIGDFGCFSFQSSKQITCGDGGMTLVNNEEHYARAKLYADKGFDRKRPAPTITFLAPNYRMTELQSAVVMAQLDRLDDLIASRRETADALTGQLREIPGIRLPDTPAGTKPAWWRFTFGIDEEAIGVSTLDFATALKVEGVKTSKEFPPRPLFEHDMLLDQITYGASRYPFSEVSGEPPKLEDFPGFCDFAKEVIPIGWSSQAKRTHVDAIAAAVRKVAGYLSSHRSPSEAIAVGVGS
jgi:dTDP-4-amino-4,6-dideoxygalactose transaminase